MTFIEWDPGFSVGVAIFDDEHKKLIAIINRLYEIVQNGGRQDDLSRIVDHLVEYTIMHFRHEEMYFDDWAYPLAERHTESHASFQNKVHAYRKDIAEKDQQRLAEVMLIYLRDWLQQHILVEDRAYGDYLHNRGVR